MLHLELASFFLVACSFKCSCTTCIKFACNACNNKVSGFLVHSGLERQNGLSCYVGIVHDFANFKLLRGFMLKFLDQMQEPELLRVDAERIRRQMQEVAVGHYRAFISAADAVQHVTQEITSVDKHLESLV